VAGPELSAGVRLPGGRRRKASSVAIQERFRAEAWCSSRRDRADGRLRGGAAPHARPLLPRPRRAGDRIGGPVCARRAAARGPPRTRKRSA